MKVYALICIMCLPLCLLGQRLEKLEHHEGTSVRGMSVVSPSIAWLSGSKGWFAKTEDGGRTWQWKQLEKYTELDFRGTVAFSSTKAILMNSGSPAVILLTGDGGQTWKEVYRNESKDIFLDGISFFNKREGLVYGDPINGLMQVLKTSDGGETWENKASLLGLRLETGEASFAASNTGICTLPGGQVWIITGGARSRVLCSLDKGAHWSDHKSPMLQGMDSRGPFSIAFYDSRTGIMTGGDYKADTLREKNAFLTTDGGSTWSPADVNPLGFRSCVVYVTKELLLATGTSGTDVSRDGGKTWTPVSDEGYHVAGVLKKGKAVLLAGGDGRIAIVHFD